MESTESSSSPPSPTMVILVSADGESFSLEMTAARRLITIKNMADDGCAGAPIPVPNVKRKILSVIVEWCKKQASGATKEEVSNLVEGLDHATLYDTLEATDFLRADELFDLVARRIAGMLAAKSPEEIRQMFHIVNDYTPEEVEEIKRKNAWAFE